MRITRTVEFWTSRRRKGLWPFLFLFASPPAGVTAKFRGAQHPPRGPLDEGSSNRVRLRWDFRAVLGIDEGNLRVLCECITTDVPCPPPGFAVDGVTLVEVLETWRTRFLTHHLVVLEFESDFIGRFFHSKELAIIAGTNLTKNGLILQIVGRQTAIMEFLNAIREAITVDRITTAKGAEGIIERGPSIQQYRIIKVAHASGWYDVPKRISIRDLAKKLELSKSTVAEQLVRAESNIVGNFLDNSR